VATPRGLVPIEKIAVGDLVLSKKEDTGEVAAKPVTDLIRPGPKPLYKLELVDAGGEGETFHATDDHPWKVEGKGWVETANLTAGDRIDTESGADMVVTALTLTERVEQTYSLTVADWHTFMVGEDHAVVHNACPWSSERRALEEMAKAYKRTGITRQDFYILQQLNQGLRDPIPPNRIRIDEGHQRGGPHSRRPHAHIGNTDYIEIVTGW